MSTNNGGFNWIERPDGRLFPGTQPASYKGGSIQVVDPETGKFETLYDSCDGRKLNGPNDLVFDDAGGFWFTDLGKTREYDNDRGAVYYARADGSKIEQKVFPLERPNGCGLSPDGKTLYVVETPTARLWAFDLSAPGTIKDANGAYRGEKGRVVTGLGGYQMFDSLAVDSAGHICVATLITGAVSDISPDGQSVTQYKLPDAMVTNVCFGGHGPAHRLRHAVDDRQAGQLRMAASGPQARVSEQIALRRSLTWPERRSRARREPSWHQPRCRARGSRRSSRRP